MSNERKTMEQWLDERGWFIQFPDTINGQASIGTALHEFARRMDALECRMKSIGYVANAGCDRVARVGLFQGARPLPWGMLERQVVRAEAASETETTDPLVATTVQEGEMSKPMTISEAVEVCKKRADRPRMVADPELDTALATLEGVRLCDESEARDIIQTLLSFTSLTPNEYVPQSDRARRWLVEHGGE